MKPCESVQYFDKSSGAQVNLELRVPSIGSGKCNCFCFRARRLKQEDHCVINESAASFELLKYAGSNSLNPAESGRRIHQIIREQCEGDEAKYLLVCAVAKLDPGFIEKPLKVGQLIKLQIIFQEIFHTTILA